MRRNSDTKKKFIDGTKSTSRAPGAVMTAKNMSAVKTVVKTKLKLEPYQVVIRPIVTEKGFHWAEHKNVYSFEVNKLATKKDIKEAVETLFDVKVIEVRTQNRKGKKARSRRSTGVRKSWKKAMVKLDAESKISYF